jgi:ribosomal protein L19
MQVARLVAPRLGLARALRPRGLAQAPAAAAAAAAAAEAVGAAAPAPGPASGFGRFDRSKGRAAGGGPAGAAGGAAAAPPGAPASAAGKPGSKGYSWVKGKSRFKRAESLMLELNLEAMQQSEKARPVPFFQSGDAVQVTYVPSLATNQQLVVRGMVTGRRNRGLSSNLRMAIVMGSPGQGIEMIFPVYSPLVKEIKVIQRAFLHRGLKRVRRSKLYYVGERSLALYKISDGFAAEMETRQKRLQQFAAAHGEAAPGDAADEDEDEDEAAPESRPSTLKTKTSKKETNVIMGDGKKTAAARKKAKAAKDAPNKP